MTCASCQRAQQIAHYGEYREGCLSCGVRRLAHMDAEERQKLLDRIQFVSGWDFRCEVVKMLREECARIKKLRGERGHLVLAWSKPKERA